MKRHRDWISTLPMRIKLMFMSVVIILLFVMVLMVLIYQLNQLTAAYDLIVKNITEANEYNIVFKEDMDSVMYQMVARSVDENEVESLLGMTSPNTLIDNAEEDFERMYNHTESSEAKGRIKSILKLLATLRRRANEINDTVKVSGHYDENLAKLDTDIRILTELIQERISEYVYYESVSMESMRVQIDNRRNILANGSIITVAVIVIIAGTLSVLISRSITKPIEELCRATDEVAHGNFDVRTHVESGEELVQLSESLNSMTSQLGTLVDNIKKEQINSRNLELKLLQAQINPHFLYNTLDNIVWLSQDDRKEDVASIVTSLSRFFRTTLSGGRDYVRVRDEISHVESYLEIQQFRYRDIMDYEIVAPEEYMNCSIIKMTLQPIVENALYHGIKNTRRKGTIRITVGENNYEDDPENEELYIEEKATVSDDVFDTDAVYSDDYDTEDNRRKALVLTVTDDGQGMNEEDLDRLNKIVRGEVKPSLDNSGFGLSNVAERLKLNYGRACDIRFSSEYGKGTKVEIIIPKKYYTADES